MERPHVHKDDNDKAHCCQRGDLPLTKADAFLMAAAPDLLAVLVEWRNAPFFVTEAAWLAWVQDFGPRVDAAIAKAKGGAS